MNTATETELKNLATDRAIELGMDDTQTSEYVARMLEAYSCVLRGTDARGSDLIELSWLGYDVRDRRQVAETIIAQLGGQSALAMMGAKDKMFDDMSVQMRIGRNPKKVNRLSITLDASDTYTVKVCRFASCTETRANEISDVYAESLRSTVESMTGLALSL